MRKVKQIVKQNGITTNSNNQRMRKLRLKHGAGDGTRTRDNLLGRQGLCQLSYSREIVSILSRKIGLVKKPITRA